MKKTLLIGLFAVMGIGTQPIFAQDVQYRTMPQEQLDSMEQTAAADYDAIKKTGQRYQVENEGCQKRVHRF